MVDTKLTTIEMHENGQSEYNYELVQGNFHYVKNGKFMRINLEPQQIVTQNLHKSSYQCHENNSHSFSGCLNDYYEIKLGCNLPWVMKNKNRSTCTSKSKFEEFRNLSFSIIDPDFKGLF